MKSSHMDRTHVVTMAQSYLVIRTIYSVIEVSYGRLTGDTNVNARDLIDNRHWRDCV